MRDYIEFLDDLGAISLESDKALREELWRRREAFIAAVKASPFTGGVVNGAWLRCGG